MESYITFMIDLICLTVLVVSWMGLTIVCSMFLYSILRDTYKEVRNKKYSILKERHNGNSK